MVEPSAGEARIPQSAALAEASVESMNELLSRDPFGYGTQDRVRIIEKLRALRAEFAKGEGAKAVKPVKASSLTLESKVNLDDLGM